MNLFKNKNKELIEIIERLEKRITELEAQLCYYNTVDKEFNKLMGASIYCYTGTKLTAAEVMNRFEELYAHLNIKRVTPNKAACVPYLEKNKK